ncbi:MAG: glycosyltransferase family 4 protein [Candidatus Pacebacteria bacterium]|nr:glycosyltransferase family 4 protein [Candidatus Paceibacterota bacterium]
MKGLYFIDTDVRNTRAHTSQILHTVAALDPYVEVDIVAPRYDGPVDLEGIRDRHGLAAAPRVIRIPVFGFKHPGSLAFACFNIPAIVFLVRHRKETSFIYIRSNLLFPIALSAACLRIPRYYETHRKPLTWTARLYDYLMTKTATGIVVISEHLRARYAAYAKRILVAHDAVSFGRFGDTLQKAEARKRCGITDAHPVCVYAGTVSRLKGADVAIAAARLMPDIDFYLVGQVEPAVAALDLPANIILTGRKEQEDVPVFLRAADVLLLPHPRGEYSQSPMKLFEYMASGVPIVASRLPSVCEVLDDTNAILVEPEDVHSLVEGIRQVVADPRRAAPRAEKARQDVEAYTWEKRGAAIALFIKDTLSV